MTEKAKSLKKSLKKPVKRAIRSAKLRTAPGGPMEDKLKNAVHTFQKLPRDAFGKWKTYIRDVK